MNKIAVRLDLSANNMQTINLLAMPSGEKTNSKKIKFVINQYLSLLAEPNDEEIIRRIKKARLLLEKR